MKTLLLLLLLQLGGLQAAEVKMDWQGKTLNADLEGASESALPPRMALILHGTLGHKNMEIIQGLQDQLAENGVASLAPNLSLELNDRHGFYDCATPHDHRHGDAVDELQQWSNWMAQRGVKELDVIGHSRGGNQVLLFALKAKQLPIRSVTSIAPMTFRQKHQTSELIKLPEADGWYKVEKFLHCENTRASLKSLKSYWFDPRQHTPALWKDYKGPFLLVLGSEDPLSNSLKPWLPTLPKDASVLTVNGADHFFRDLYLDEVVEFFLENRS